MDVKLNPTVDPIPPSVPAPGIAMAAPLPVSATTVSPIARNRPSGARALVCVLAVVAFIGQTIVLSYVLDIWIGPDQQGAIDSVIFGAAILVLAGLPLLIVCLLPWWQRAVSLPLAEDGGDRAIRILWWSAGLAALGMFYALRNLLPSAGGWRLVIDEELALLPLPLLTLWAMFSLITRKGWAKVLARVVFIVFGIPWILYNPIGSIVGLGIMFFGLRALRDVQPVPAPAPARLAESRWSPDGFYWWDGQAWRPASPDHLLFWDGAAWRALT